MDKVSVLIFVLCATLTASLAFPRPANTNNNQDIITQPKPGEEYVFVQTSAAGARPISRKEKHQERPFETSHKLPPSLTYVLNQEDIEENVNKKEKRSAAEGPAPAPAGAIKLDVAQLLAKYKTELKTSTTTPSVQSTKSSSRRKTSGSNKRTKKETKVEDSGVEVTTPSSVLTTAASAPKKIVDEDVALVASGSEKQRSRIQIKKGPNGQEYEYEYVYYYYDEDEEAKEGKVSNSHDGPARNQVTQKPRKSASAEKNATHPEVNEVVPSSGGKSRTRGRQLGEEAETQVGEERLPANTRFPPRSRNLNTTPLPEEETVTNKATTTRGRGRGRPTTEAAPETDNVSDETQGSRGRTRANVRRPSLELVDNASFNTHSNTGGAPSSPAFPADLPAGPVRFLGATPNESVDPPEPIKSSSPVEEEAATVQPAETEGTTVMSPMDKVALDLYAILQGTQKLSGEDSEASSSDESSSTNLSSEEEEVTTIEPTTEVIIETTTPTTTTSTTTTTQAPTTTTTTTEAPVTGRGRFKGRGNRKTTHAAASSTTESVTETKPKGKFSRPSFGGRPRPGARTTPAPEEEQVAVKEDSKPVSHSRPTLSRGRFGTGTRSRTRTPSSTEASEESSSAATPSSRPSSLTRPRSSFNLRTRGRTTAAPATEESEDNESSHAEVSSTTSRTRKIQAGSAVRPLRPGPRINLRTRPGQSTTSTTEEPAEDHVTGDDADVANSSNTSETSEDKEATGETSAAPVDNSPLGRLKNKHRVNVQPRPKAAASAPVQVRRVNPLIARRRPAQTSSESSASSETPAVQESSTETVNAVQEESENTEDSSVSSSTTTEEPKGLNKLLAGRRRLAVRPTAH